MNRMLVLAALVAATSAGAQPDCAAKVAHALQSNEDMRASVFRSPAHAHIKALALAELKRSDELLAKSCPERTQQDADRRIEAAVARMNAEQILKRGKPLTGGTL